MNDTMEKLGEIQNLMQRVGKEDPAWMNSFQSFLKATKKDGALSSKMKEIIGLAVSSTISLCLLSGSFLYPNGANGVIYLPSLR